MSTIHSSLHELSGCFVLVVFMLLLFSFLSFVLFLRERGNMDELGWEGRERIWKWVIERKIGLGYIVQKKDKISKHKTTMYFKVACYKVQTVSQQFLCGLLPSDTDVETWTAASNTSSKIKHVMLIVHGFKPDQPEFQLSWKFLFG